MEFIAREVKRSKKKKRLHAFPPDRPDLDRKGFIVLCFCKMAWKKRWLRMKMNKKYNSFYTLSSVSESQNLFYETFHFSFFWNQTVFTNKQIASCEIATEYKISPWLDEIALFFPVSFCFFIDHMILSAGTNVSDSNLKSLRKPVLVCSVRHVTAQVLFLLRLRIWFFIAGKTKGVDGAAGSRLKAFDKELTDTSKKALKSFRQRLVVYDGAVCKMTHVTYTEKHLWQGISRE